MLAHGFQYLPAIHLRHHHIEDDECDLLICEKDVDRFLAVTGLHGLIALDLQKIGNQLPHPLFIIDDQYF